MHAREARPALILRIDVLFVDGVQVHSMGFLPPIGQKTMLVRLQCRSGGQPFQGAPSALQHK